MRADPDRAIRASLDLVGDFAEPFRQAERVESVRGSGTLPNFFRKPYGNGWALVGDAGYHKDPILAQGISDAFRRAEWLAGAIDAGLSGGQALGAALADYQRSRDEHLAPMSELTCQLAALEPPPPEVLALYVALRHDAVERSNISAPSAARFRSLNTTRRQIYSASSRALHDLKRYSLGVAYNFLL